jgi:hypothetical protein
MIISLNSIKQISIFCDIIQCSPLKAERSFGGKRRSHLQRLPVTSLKLV